jgi:hypothetical protein
MAVKSFERIGQFLRLWCCPQRGNEQRHATAPMNRHRIIATGSIQLCREPATDQKLSPFCKEVVQIAANRAKFVIACLAPATSRHNLGQGRFLIGIIRMHQNKGDAP